MGVIVIRTVPQDGAAKQVMDTIYEVLRDNRAAIDGFISDSEAVEYSIWTICLECMEGGE